MDYPYICITYYVIQRLLSPTNAILIDPKTDTRLPRSYHINKFKKVPMRPRLSDKMGQQTESTKIENNKRLVDDQPIAQGKAEIRQREFIPLDVIRREDKIGIPDTIESDDDIIVQNDKEKHQEVDNIPMDVQNDKERDQEIDKISGDQENEDVQSSMQNNTEEGKPVIVNAPTESYLEDIDVSNDGGDLFYPIKKFT